MAGRQHGLPAQGSPGRGKVPSRLLSPKPESMASWQHGVPAGTAATSEAPWSKGAQGEEGFRRDSCLRNPSPWPAGSMGCRRERPRIPKPTGARECGARKGSVETHVSRDPSPWPAGSMGCRRKGVQGEERFRRDCCLRNPSPWPAGSMGCRRERPQLPKPPGAREPRARKGSVETHVSETQVHGLLAARAAGGDGYHRRGAVFGRATKLKVCRR